jgi:hypothetical protein
LSVAPRLTRTGKHCFVPCPPHLCNCRDDKTRFLTEDEKREVREARRRNDVQAALHLGDEKRALELALED